MARILIVDDERLIQQLLSQLLKEDGHSCETAGNVAEGRRAMEGGQVFDLVFCDVDMPDGSGLDLVKEMRGDGNDLPVVMMSGVHDASLAARAVDLGVEGYMLKPFPLEDVRERVAKILGPSV